MKAKKSKRGRPVAGIVLTPEERQKLELMANRPTSSQRDAFRARIILGCGSGLTNKQVAKRCKACVQTVGQWRGRFAVGRLEALRDLPRSGPARRISDARVEQVVTRTLESVPAGRTHWSSRTMAKAEGLSDHTVRRIWRAFGLKPHVVKRFKLSTDPMFVEKVRDIVGLYLNPPEKAVVLCVDEKSQTQALERSQPILPLRPGLPERQTHDYIRHGTLSLFAAYDAATGKVTGHCHERHRQQEFVKFLERVDAAYPDDGQTTLHLVLDNYGTHKTPKVQRWLLRHPRFEVHFTPTSSSWINLVERFFGLITNDAIRRGSFTSTRGLKEAIDSYIAEHNKSPKPFLWTASADVIFKKLENSLI
jgi:transposase